MRLVDPQSMETLPEEGKVFLDETRPFIGYDKPLTPSMRVTYEVDVKIVREHMTYKGYICHAWSYTATNNPLIDK